MSKHFNELVDLQIFITANISFLDWEFVVKEKGGVPFVQVQFDAPNNYDPEKIDRQHCRKWQLSYWMTPTEVVQTCWAAIQRAVLHEASEQFKYKGQDIYNTHMRVDHLAKLRQCHDALEHRGEIEPALVS